ncbi:WD40 repeat domain-containing serine/threonine protein kinase [Acrocarpospora catenulata]|uniref:WD40 repeat domain-containing serine/threonine protein kinase n=1 Tax=Acrocarpospora catenulata TaxID=2836182 RepID=UPI001BD9AE0E|nr:WD40 repeat domain-containing serine/threonine protein kinase [Acrocarpospora catenulata]
MRIGSYTVIRRLGAGGQGVVYLAESESGRQVAVKVLHAVADEGSVTRFLREAEVLPDVASFCTAQVLESGTADGVPYIVSEYVAGPTLLEAVRERGPLRGAELRRLAAGTVTALAAIHQAGVVHRDFKPANVLLSRDGPRVIDFGIARVVNAEATSEGPLGTPAYMAPEQLRETPPGPAADMFAWGSTMVFAASGYPAFGADAVPAVLNRILRGEPDLGDLDGDLRELVAACLNKDPAARPRAGDVLLRLLGSEAAQPAEPPRRRRRRAAVAVALGAVAITATTVVLLTRPPPPVELRLSGPPAQDTRAVEVPALRAVFHEHASDPVKLTTFLVRETQLRVPTYIRVPGTDTFERQADFRDPVVSPDGTTIAAVYRNPGSVGDGNVLQITDRASGAKHTIPTVDLPLLVRTPAWSRDGERVLLTLYESENNQVRGFAVVEVDTRATTVTTLDDTKDLGDFQWTPDGSVLSAAPDGLRVYAPDGTVRRTLTDLRHADASDVDFSPSGRLLAALCARPATSVCVVDAATGATRATFPLPTGAHTWGWFNEDHLLVYNTTPQPWTVTIVDLRGRSVRPFAEISGDKDTWWLLHWGRHG